MSILDDLAKDQRVQGRGDCVVCDWIKIQPSPDEWDKALAAPTKTYSTASISRLAIKYGATFSMGAVKRHRQAGHRR